MTESTLPRFCQAMKDLGLIPQSYPTLGFRYETTVQTKNFSLLIHEPDEYFLYPPKVSILEKPALSGIKQTHIMEGDNLCYVDEQVYYFEREAPEKAAKDIIGYINKTLERMLSKTLSHEDFNKEFDAYWKPNIHAYNIANTLPKCMEVYSRNSVLGSEQTEEYVIHDGHESASFMSWREKRGYLERRGDYIENVIYMQLHKEPVPKTFYQHNAWPISTWQGFLVWSQSQGNDFIASLLQKLAKITLHTSDVTFIFSYENAHEITHYFGMSVKFNSSIRAIAKRDARARASATKLKRKGRKLMDIISMFSSQRTKSVKRVKVENTTCNFISGRNTLNKTCKDMVIAIVGCGTLGGHIAQTLVKLGGGAGESGKLILCDYDTLKSENLGRHVLDERYLGERKNESLANYLQASTYWEIQCEYLSVVNLTQADRLLKRCDIIIDAVGNIPLSKMISSRFHQSSQTRTQKLLHSWIEARGQATRCLLDEKQHGCINCLRIDGIERFPIFKRGQQLEGELIVPISCGQSFTPYAESVSMAGAALAINTLLDSLNKAKAPSFRQYNVSNKVPELKWQHLSKLKSCKNCGHAN